MQTLAIVGVGLVGGSFGLALREAGFEGEIIGVSSPPALAAAARAGAISASASLGDACSRADVVYLSQPVERILATIARLGPLLRPGALVTDAGSTKASIVRQAAEFLPGAAFLGGHPMAGKEARGAAAADAALFQDRPYILTPSIGPPSPHEPEFRRWLGRIGALVVELPPEEHDRIVALTSHLPQILSTTLAAMLDSQGGSSAETVFGPGLLDMTRLALSPVEVWASILSENRPAILTAIDAYLFALTRTRTAVESGNLAELFDSGRNFSAHIRKTNP